MEILCPNSGKVIRRGILGPSGFDSRFLSEFEEIEILGSGAFGCVVRCQNKVDQQYYAVKKVVLGGEYGLDFDRVIGEVRYLAQVSDDNVVRYYQAWFESEVVGMYETEFEDVYDGPCLYLQQELCYKSLHDIRYDKKEDTLPVWDVLKQILFGLRAIHDKGIRHGDLKPANIFVLGDKVKIGDFGLATCLEGFAGVDVAQGLYVGPELKDGSLKEFTLKSDIYSLGLICCELLFAFNTEQERIQVLSNLEMLQEHNKKFHGMNKEMKEVLLGMVSSQYTAWPTILKILEALETQDKTLVERSEIDGDGKN